MVEWNTPLLLSIGLVLMFINLKRRIQFLDFRLDSFLYSSGPNMLLVLLDRKNYCFSFSVCLVWWKFFWPWIISVAILGLVLMFGSLLWAMADIWPGQEIVGLIFFSCSSFRISSILRFSLCSWLYSHRSDGKDPNSSYDSRHQSRSRSTKGKSSNLGDLGVT